MCLSWKNKKQQYSNVITLIRSEAQKWNYCWSSNNTCYKTELLKFYKCHQAISESTLMIQLMIDFWNWSKFLILGNRTSSQSEEHWVSFCSYSLRQWKTGQVKATKAKPQVHWTHREVGTLLTGKPMSVSCFIRRFMIQASSCLLDVFMPLVNKREIPLMVCFPYPYWWDVHQMWSVFHININVIKWYINTFIYKVFKKLQTM